MTVRWAGDRLRELRLARGMSVHVLGSLAGVNYSSLSNYERGREPTLTCGVRIARALGLAVEDLLVIEEPEQKAPELRRGTIVSMAPGPVILEEIGEERRLNGPWRVQQPSPSLLLIESARKGLRTPQVIPLPLKKIIARAEAADGIVHLTLSAQPVLHPSGEWTFRLATPPAAPDSKRA